MKTKELIRLLAEYTELFDQTEDVIMGMYWTVGKKTQSLKIYGPTPRQVSAWLGKYTATPIEEREEAEKFLLVLPDIFDDRFLNCESKSYFFGNDENWAGFKTHYTNEDIKNLPQEIKGVIECGLLKKVKV